MDMLDAKRIKEIRISLGMTQPEFAKALGKSYAAIASWEVGSRHPNWNSMEKIHALEARAKRRKAQLVQ